MILESFPSGVIETNVVIFACPQTKEAAIVDAPQDCLDSVKKFLENHSLNVKMILFTHSHWDHIADAAAMKKAFSAPIYIHREDVSNLEHPGSDKLPLYFPIEGVAPDHFLQEGEKLSLGNLEIEVIHTPGHTPGSVCFYIPKEAILISGDTLFQGTMGRLDLPTGRPRLMGASLKKLAKLPKTTKVYPGHGDPTTIGDEMWIATYGE